MNRKIGIGLVVLLVLGGLFIGWRLNQPSHDPMEEPMMNEGMMEEESMDEMDEGMMEEESMDEMDESMMEEESMDEMDEGMMEEEPMDETKGDKMSNEPMNEGLAAPEFDLVNLEGEHVILSELKGEKVLIKFWASWCNICLSGMDQIDALAGEDHDFRVLSVVAPGYNGEKNIDDFRAWYETRNIKHLEVLIDSEAAVMKAFGVRGYPTNAFIGSDGILVGTFPGHLENEQIIEVFEDIY